MREEAPVEQFGQRLGETESVAVLEPVDELPDGALKGGGRARQVERGAPGAAAVADRGGGAERGLVRQERLAADRAAALRRPHRDARAAGGAEQFRTRRAADGAPLRVEELEKRAEQGGKEKREERREKGEKRWEKR